jgi:hypothetical protein
MSRARYFLLQVIVAAGVFAFLGCGKIKGPDFGYMESPRTIVATPASPASGDVTITYQLMDRELELGTIILEYSTDNGQTYNTATLTVPGEATNLASAWHPGKVHTVQWDSVTDCIAISGDTSVCVKVTPSDASNPAGTAGVSGTFTVNNIAYNEAPTATTATPAGVQSGNVQINYFLADVESDICSIAVLYSTNDGTSWQTASMAPAGEGLTGLSSSPSGTAHAFLWDSRADNVAPTGQLDTIKVKITPTDFHVGNAGETNSFSVDNSITNNPPTVNITSGPADGSTVSTNQVTFGWSGSDTDGSVIGYYYSFDHDPPDIWTTDTSVISSPLSEGQHTFRVVAMDDDNDLSAVASRVFTVSTAAALEITTTSLPNGIEGQSYSAQLQATGGNPSYTWSCISGSLAAIGLSLDTGTGEITGVLGLGTAGTYPYTFRAEDSSGPPQSAQKPLSITIFAPGADLTRTASDCDFGPDDGNVKLLFEDNMIKLAPEGDVFGNSLDLTHWQKTSGDYIETGGIIVSQSGTGGVDTLERQIDYGDADVAVHWSNTYPDLADKTYGGYPSIYLGKDPDNWVRILFFARKIGTPKCNFDTGKMVNGVYTLLDWTSGVGLQTSVKLRIRRRRSDNYFWVYYDIGSGWVLTWSGIIDHPGYFDTSHYLKPRLSVVRGTNTDDWRPEADRYYQYTGDIPAQRFWPDSPECDIIDSSAGTPEYCLDAGSGGTWTLTGCAPMVFLPGTSTIKFRAGWSDSATRATATWINGGAWMTYTEIDAQVAAGALDGHRYVFLKAQFNSDSTDQPILTSVTFTGAPGNSYTVSAFDTSPALDDNNQKVIVDTGTAKLAPEGDEFGSALDTVNWTESSEIGAEGGSLLESASVLTNVSGTPSTLWDLIAKREFAYGDCDLVFEWEDTKNQIASNLAARVYSYLWLNATNCVWAEHRSRRFSGAYDHLQFRKHINGVTTTLFNVNYSGLPSKVRFRIKRVAATNTFTFYTAEWNGSSWDAYVQRWSGVIYDATHFNYAHQLFPRSRIIHWAMDPTEFTPELGAYFQKTDDGIAAQRFWDDSPECNVVNSGAVDWAFDAGVGQVWEISDASCVKSEPGTSSVKFKIGQSDTGNVADAFWPDPTWLTISEVKARAATGAYDSYQYIHVKAQFNSDGTDQPALSSFSIYGAKVP